MIIMPQDAVKNNVQFTQKHSVKNGDYVKMNQKSFYTPGVFTPVSHFLIFIGMILFEV